MRLEGCSKGPFKKALGELSGDQISGDQISRDQISGDQISGDQISGDQKYPTPPRTPPQSSPSQSLLEGALGAPVNAHMRLTKHRLFYLENRLFRIFDPLRTELHRHHESLMELACSDQTTRFYSWKSEHFDFVT